MEKFLFIIREDLKKHSQQTEEERYDDIRKMDEWVRALADSGNYLYGDALEIAGKYVNKQIVLSDGPFIEAKEAISGFVMMQAKDLDHAVAMAHSCPHVKDGNMAIEIRPLMGFTDVRELGDEKRATGSR